MLSVPFAAALTASVLSTSFISGVFGMAGGMILMGFMLSFMPLAPAMALHGITQIASNATRAWLWRQHIGWPLVLRYGTGAVAAVVAVLLGLSAPSKSSALIFLGLATFVGLWLPARFTPNVTDQRQAIGCGTLCTGLQLVCGVGGAVGIAMLQTFLTKREQYHSNVLTQSVSLLEQATRTRTEKLMQYFMNHGIADHADASHRAVVAIGKIVQKQAFILAFSDMFFLLGAALIVALMAALLLKKPDHLATGGAH